MRGGQAQQLRLCGGGKEGPEMEHHNGDAVISFGPNRVMEGGGGAAKEQDWKNTLQSYAVKNLN